MRVSLAKRGLKAGLSGAALLWLAGCAGLPPSRVTDRIQTDLPGISQGDLALVPSGDEQRRRTDQVQALLAQPLGAPQAVQLALLHSPEVQALLAQGWADMADAAQRGRIANPVLGLERMVAGDGLELGRSLGFGLLDLATLPARQRVAQHRVELAQLRLSGEVLAQITMTRQAWVRAVTAAQKLKYAQQVYDSAQASAELARRMQAVGNFNRLSRAREHAFYADAATRLATAGHEATASRETLVRQLGLDEAQEQALKLPDRLPDLPLQAAPPEAVAAMATRGRLDILAAQAALDAATQAQGLGKVTRWTDIELTAQQQTSMDSATGARHSARGVEVAVRVPVFDGGALRRDGWNARSLAAAHQLQATVRAAGSALRESYSAYRSAHDIARHLRDEVLPLRKVIAEENLLRYNGMLIGVFELMTDARDQVNTVVAAIDAEQQFWLADAALQASLLGRMTTVALANSVSPPSSPGAGH